MRQPAWDQYETALLIEAYINITNEPSSRKATVHGLSQTLRERAVKNGKLIDNVYRNVNGINLRLYEIQYLFLDNGRGITKTSRLFKNMVNLYKNDKSEFMAVLRKAKGEDKSDRQRETTDRHYIRDDKENFYNWLISKNIEKNEATRIVRSLKKAEDYAKEEISSNCKLLSATTDEIIKTIQTLTIYSPFIEQAETENNWQIKALRYYLEYSTINSASSVNTDHTPILKIDSKKRIIRQSRNLMGWTVYRKVKSTESYLNKQKQVKSEYERDAITKRQATADISYVGYANDEESYKYWLYDIQNLSDATCKNNLSAIRAAERYLLLNEYEPYTLFGAEKKEAASAVRFLLDDITFCKTYGTYKSQLRKYLSYLEYPNSSYSKRNNKVTTSNRSNSNQGRGAYSKVDSVGIRDDDDLYRLKYPYLYTSIQNVSNTYYRPNGFTLNEICRLVGTNDKRTVYEILEHVSWALKEKDGSKYYLSSKSNEGKKTQKQPKPSTVKNKTQNVVERPSDILKRKILNSECISIGEITSYARANKLSFSLLYYLNSFNDTHFLIDGFTLADINYIGINKEIAKIVEAAILDEITETVPIADLNCISSFPEINVPWNAWLIYSTLKRWSNKIDVAASNSHFRNAFPLVAPKNRMANSFSNFPALPHSGEIAKVDDLDIIDDLIEDYIAEELGYEL